MKTHNCSMDPSEQEWNAICDAIDEETAPPWPEMYFHLEKQNTSLPGWQMLLQLIEDAAHDKREVLNPREHIDAEMWRQVITLPASIGQLKHVKKINLYHSHIIRIPPEIGEMASLEDFDAYCSYGLHWLPFEITRCKQLKSSTLSTRALYGNYKYRPPFPRVDPANFNLVPNYCSVCNGPINLFKLKQVWLSLGVATDVMPLLVNACSDECIKKLPKPSTGYVQYPHTGGLEIIQPYKRN